MSGSSLAVKITADTVALKAQLAVAQAEVRNFSAEVKNIAEAQREAGSAGSKYFVPALESAIADQQRASAEAIKLKTALGDVGGAAHEAGGSMSTATREFRALFDEISSGRTRRSPGTIAIIANRVFGLTGATLAAIGGVLGLAGGLAYLTVEAAKTQNALQNIFIGAQFTGNTAIAKTQIEGLVSEIETLGDVSQKEAMKVVNAFARIRGSTTPLLQGLSVEIADYAQATGQNMDKASEEISKAFSNPLKEGTKFLELFPNTTQAQLDAMAAAIRAGNEYQAEALMLEALHSALKPVRSAIDEQNRSVTNSLGNWLAYGTAVMAGASADQIETAAIKDQNAQRAKQNEILKASAANLKTMPLPPEAALKLGFAAGAKFDTTHRDILDTKAAIDQINAALAVARERGSEVDVGNLTRELAEAQKHLDELNNKGQKGAHTSLMPQFETELAQERAASNASRAQQLADDQAFWQRVLATQKLSATDRLSVERNLANATVALHQQQAQATAQAQRTSEAIARQNADTDLAINKTTFDAKKAVLQQQVAAGKISNQQEVAALKDAVEQEYQLDLQSLNNELSTLQPRTEAYNRVYDEILKLKAKNVVDQAALDRQAANNAKRAAEEQQREWVQALRPITSGFDSMIRGMISGHQSLSQSATRAAATMVEDFLEADAKRLSSWLATEAAELLAKIMGDDAKVVSTTTSNAASSASNTSTSLASIGKHAASAAAAVYDDVAQIPYVGWLLAPAAAAASFAAVMAFGGMIPSAAGGMVVGGDGLIMAHAQEMVLPATLSTGMQDIISSHQTALPAISGAASGAVASGPNVTVQMSVSAMDAQSFKAYINSPVASAQITRVVSRALANNPSMRGAY